MKIFFFNKMYKTFITTLEVYPENLNTSINEYLLTSLKNKFNNTCLNGYLIKQVTEIIKRGSIVSPRNDYSGICLCDIQFMAEYITYEKGDILVVTVTNVDDDSLVCIKPEYTIHIKKDPQFNLEIGSRFICVINNISYEAGNSISMTARIYKPVNKTQLSECFNSHEESIVITQSLNLCLSRIQNLYKIIESNTYAKKIIDIFSKGYNKSKLIFDKYDCNKILEFTKIPAGPIYFIVSPNDIISTGTFRIAPINTPESMLIVDAPVLLRKEPISLQSKFYKFSVSLCNYLEALIALGDYQNDIDFDKNRVVWDYYELISKN